MSTTARQIGAKAASSKGAVKRIREQGVKLQQLVMRSAASAGMLLGVWLVGYFQYNVTWVIVPSFVYVGVMEYRKSRKLAAGKQDSELSFAGRVEELPSWVSMLTSWEHYGCKFHSINYRQRLWLRLGVNVDGQLWLRLNPIPIPNCNPSANPSPSPSPSPNTNPNLKPKRPTTRRRPS